MFISSPGLSVIRWQSRTHLYLPRRPFELLSRGVARHLRGRALINRDWVSRLFSIGGFVDVDLGKIGSMPRTGMLRNGPIGAFLGHSQGQDGPARTRWRSLWA